jgi:non-specific serine/threonine protein kinase/serine/threonine-protein kinase
LYRTAIADQGAQPPTAKNMIDSSAQRVLHDYHDQPQLAGPLVLTLADLYGALEDVSGAGTLLEGFVADAGPNTDPAALADARQKLANIELLRGHPERAAQLLDQADAFWSSNSKPYLEERLEGLAVRARLLRAKGDLAGAIAATHAAIDKRIALSGRNHRETAVLYNSLAISEATAGHFDQALDAYHETTSIYRAIGLGDTIDAQVVLANTGVLEFRLGHLKTAEVLLKSSIERERSLAGDSAAVGAAMGYYGKLLSVTNRNDAAIPVLREATQIGEHYTGASSPLSIQNRIYLGEAQLGVGDKKTALATLTSAHDAAVAALGPAHPVTLRSRLALSQWMAANAEDEKARIELSATIEGMRKLGPQGEPNLAQALEVQGDAEMRLGHLDEATATLKEAVTIREKSPEDQYELAEARERLGEVLLKSGSPGARELLKQAAHDLESQLGADHPQTLRAKGVLANST